MMPSPVSRPSEIAPSNEPHNATTYLAHILDYYPDVDVASLIDNPLFTGPAEAALCNIAGRFDLDGVYVRAGRAMNGRDEIERFFRTAYPEGRRGLVGEHHIERGFELDPSSGIVIGTFVRDDGWSKQFADLWIKSDQVSASGAILTKYRESFLLDRVIEPGPDLYSGRSSFEVYSELQVHKLAGGVSIVLGTVTSENEASAHFLDYLNPQNDNPECVRRFLSRGHEILKPAPRSLKTYSTGDNIANP